MQIGCLRKHSHVVNNLAARPVNTSNPAPHQQFGVIVPQRRALTEHIEYNLYIINLFLTL